MVSQQHMPVDLTEGNRVYAENKRGNYEDCWIVRVDRESSMAIVDFRNGDEPSLVYIEKLRAACEHCGGMSMDGCCDGD